MRVIGFIGVGELALYTIKGLRRGGYSGRILLGPRNREKAVLLQQDHGCEMLADNQAVVTHSDCVFIATRPADCIDTLAELRFRPSQVLVSVAAGVKLDQLQGAVDDNIEIVRAMPVSSAEVGASPTLVYPRNAFVCDLFDHCGAAVPVDEERYFDQGTILACVYSWYFALFEELIQAIRGPDLPADVAARLVTGMARGAAETALADDRRSPGEIANGIASEGTYSRLGLDLLNESAAFGPWRDACHLLQNRLKSE